MKNNPFAQNLKVSLDADHQGHLVCVLNEYRNYIRMHIEDFLESDDTDSRVTKPLELADLFYLTGNVEGRLLSDSVTASDLELIETWEQELEEFKTESEDTDDDYNLHVIVHLPQSNLKDVPVITKHLRFEWSKIRPFTHLRLTWLIEDPEIYDHIQLNIEVLVSPKHLNAMTNDLFKVLTAAKLQVSDHYTE